MNYAFCKRFPRELTAELFEHVLNKAIETHTVCERYGIVLDAEVTPGNVHGSIAFDPLYDRIRERFEIQTVVGDAAYKTPWITKRIIDAGKIPSISYTRAGNIKPGHYRPWKYDRHCTRQLHLPAREGLTPHDDRPGRQAYLSKQPQGVPGLSGSGLLQQ